MTFHVVYAFLFWTPLCSIRRHSCCDFGRCQRKELSRINNKRYHDDKSDHHSKIDLSSFLFVKTQHDQNSINKLYLSSHQCTPDSTVGCTCMQRSLVKCIRPHSILKYGTAIMLVDYTKRIFISVHSTTKCINLI